MEHTTGKLIARESRIYFEGNAGGFDIAYCPAPIANARRLVACWNACEGVSTEWLEAQTDPASEELFGKSEPMDKRLQAAMQEAEALKAQRDELLATLGALTHYAECQVRAFSGGTPYLDMTLFPSLCASARAVLAKHDGGAARATEGSV